MMPEPDVVLEILLRMADQLIPAPHTGVVRHFERGIPTAIIVALPEHGEFIRALQADSLLCALFPDNEQLVSSPSRLAGDIINAAAWRCFLAEEWTRECLRSHISSGVNAIRRLASGKEVTGTAYTGLNAELPAGTQLETPYGLLRAVRKTDERLFDNPPGNAVSPRGCVLESPYKMKWTVRSGDEPGSIHAPHAADDVWKPVCLALLLAPLTDDSKPAIRWFTAGTRPLSWGSNGGWLSHFRPGPIIPADKVGQLADLMSRIHESRPSMTAISRTLSMISRSDDLDAFVDGVVAWEALFTRGSHYEITFRMSMNMAAVLSDDPGQRFEFHRQLTSLYKLRSTVVHGENIDWREVRDARLATHRLTLDAFRRLLSLHPKLVGAGPVDFVRFIFGA